MATHLNWEHIYKWFKEERFVVFIDTLAEFDTASVKTACHNDAVRLIHMSSYEDCIALLGSLSRQMKDSQPPWKMAVVISDANALAPMEYLQAVHQLGSNFAPAHIHPKADTETDFSQPVLKAQLLSAIEALKPLDIDVEVGNLDKLKENE